MIKLDILAFGAHPDDVELGIGGTIAKLAQKGLIVGIIDLTQGEMSSRGTVDERKTEAHNAGKILNVHIRENLRLPDAQISSSWEQKIEVIKVIREYTPQLIIAPMKDDKHPDHHNAHFLIREANYFSGLHKVNTGEQAPYRCPTLIYYYPYYEISFPHLLIDISEHFENKLSALKAYKSQFFNPDYDAPETFISSERFWKSIKERCAYWGSKINKEYAEALYLLEPINISELRLFL
ncbi:MAG: bacillithiol biosynthesis deacetylase BshB1 [Candidatus Hydrogenedentes bacterium]|nr:bacillithiol biosynthesis deacetylase BshB1 [Candidatus Hydrogenedentota bacterium]